MRCGSSWRRSGRRRSMRGGPCCRNTRPAIARRPTTCAGPARNRATGTRRVPFKDRCVRATRPPRGGRTIFSPKRVSAIACPRLSEPSAPPLPPFAKRMVGRGKGWGAFVLSSFRIRMTLAPTRLASLATLPTARSARAGRERSPRNKSGDGRVYPPCRPRQPYCAPTCGTKLGGPPLAPCRRPRRNGRGRMEAP
jgi:hypothetical protein